MQSQGTSVKCAAAAGALLTASFLPAGVPAQSQPTGRLLTTVPFVGLVECNSDGSNCFTVVNNGQGNLPSGASNFSMASNGTIAFDALSSIDGSCVPGGQGICRSHVFVMDADGTNVRQLTFNPADASQFGGDNSAAISPDGTMVAFVSNRNPAHDGNGVPVALYQIYVVNADGSDLRQLTFPVPGQPGSPQAGGVFGEVLSVAWSPDGGKLAFRGNQYGTFCGTFSGFPIQFDVVGVINVDGTGQTYLTCVNPGTGGGSSLDWSPDGTLIAYGRSGLGEPVVAFIDLSLQGRYASGLTLAQLGNINACDLQSPQCIHFSPDSTQLAYVNAANTISTIHLDGTGQMATSVGFGGGTSGGSPPGIWWAAGTIPAAANLTLAPDPVEVWPGHPQQLTPTLRDASSNVILHTAASYHVEYVYFPSCSIDIGPYGLVMFRSLQSGFEGSTISVTNEGLTSNSVLLKCWASPPCTYALSASGDNFSAAEGSGSVGVIADPGANDSTCPWDAMSDAPWITITSDASGSGNGQVSFTVAENAGPARQGTMTIAGQTFIVDQDEAGPPPSADLSITQTDSPDPVTAGSDLTYTITVTNNGPDGATGVTVSDSLPGVMTFVSATPSQGSCSGTSPVTCLLGSLASGGAATVTIVVTPTQAGGFSNTASVAANEIDLVPGNNSATQATTVIQRGLARVVKTVNGVAPSGVQSFTFQIRQGASTTLAGTILETGAASGGNGGVIDFSITLVPGTPYQLCEQVMPGWMTTLGPPFFAVFNPSGDNSTVCTNFTVNPGETKPFAIDNRPPPGGLARGLGFWKNWASCAASRGNQKPVLDQTLQLGDISIGILLLHDGDVDPNVASDCVQAVRLLSKQNINTSQSMAADAAFNLAAQLLAAKLNVQAGAGVCAHAVNAVNAAQTLLAAIGFNGITHSAMTAAQARQANSLATTLDRYNNNTLCQP